MAKTLIVFAFHPQLPLVEVTSSLYVSSDMFYVSSFSLPSEQSDFA